MSDMSGGKPLYKKAYIFSSSPIPKELVNHIKYNTSVLPRVRALRKMNLEYFPIASRGFIIDQETTTATPDQKTKDKDEGEAWRLEWEILLSIQILSRSCILHQIKPPKVAASSARL